MREELPVEFRLRLDDTGARVGAVLFWPSFGTWGLVGAHWVVQLGYNEQDQRFLERSAKVVLATGLT